MKEARLIGTLVLFATLVACDDDSSGRSGAGQQPPPEPITYSVNLTAAEFDRAADQTDLVVDGLPVQGATVTVD